MPTRLPRHLPTFWNGVRLYVLLVAFYWYGYRRRAASRRMARIGADRGLARWENAAHRWLACSAKIAALLGEPEPVDVRRMRDAMSGEKHG